MTQTRDPERVRAERPRTARTFSLDVADGAWVALSSDPHGDRLIIDTVCDHVTVFELVCDHGGVVLDALAADVSTLAASASTTVTDRVLPARTLPGPVPVVSGWSTVATPLAGTPAPHHMWTLRHALGRAVVRFTDIELRGGLLPPLTRLRDFHHQFRAHVIAQNRARYADPPKDLS